MLLLFWVPLQHIIDIHSVVINALMIRMVSNRQLLPPRSMRFFRSCCLQLLSCSFSLIFFSSSVVLAGRKNWSDSISKLSILELLPNFAKISSNILVCFFISPSSTVILSSRPSGAEAALFVVLTVSIVIIWIGFFYNDKRFFYRNNSNNLQKCATFTQ